MDIKIFTPPLNFCLWNHILYAFVSFGGESLCVHSLLGARSLCGLHLEMEVEFGGYTWADSLYVGPYVCCLYVRQYLHWPTEMSLVNSAAHVWWRIELGFACGAALVSIFPFGLALVIHSVLFLMGCWLRFSPFWLKGHGFGISLFGARELWSWDNILNYCLLDIWWHQPRVMDDQSSVPSYSSARVYVAKLGDLQLYSCKRKKTVFLL